MTKNDIKIALTLIIALIVLFFLFQYLSKLIKQETIIRGVEIRQLPSVPAENVERLERW